MEQNNKKALVTMATSSKLTILAPFDKGRKMSNILWFDHVVDENRSGPLALVVTPFCELG